MKLTLIKRQVEVPGVESFFFEPDEEIVWSAGQFLHYVLHHSPTDDRGSDRWFTIAAAPSERVVRLTTRVDALHGSTFKKALFVMKTGEEIEASVLEGDFLFDDTATAHVFIAGGIGITPFRAILKDLDAKAATPPIILLYANRDDQFVYREELDGCAAKNPHLQIHYLPAPARIDLTTIHAFVPDMASPVFYVSGPEPMVEGMGELLKGAGVPAVRIRQDWFPGYVEG